MPNPIIFPPQKVDVPSLVNRNVSDWHQFFTGFGATNNLDQWVKIASWKHNEKYSSFSAKLKIVTRFSSVQINITTAHRNGDIEASWVSLSKQGTEIRNGMKVQLRSSELIIDDNKQTTFSLWVLMQSYDDKGFISTESILEYGNLSLEIKTDYKDEFIDGAEPSEGTIYKELGLKQGGINYAFVTPNTQIVMLNGFTSHTDPLSISISATGLATATGVISTTNEDGSPATSSSYTNIAIIPVGLRPKRNTRRPMLTGSNSVIGLNVSISGAIQFTSPFTASVYIEFEYQL